MARLDITTPIFIGVIPQRKRQITDRAREACEIVNKKIFAVLQELELPVEQESDKLVEFLKDYRNFENYLAGKLAQHEQINEVSNKALRLMLLDKINERIDAVMTDNRWGNMVAFADELCVIDDVCTPNAKIIDCKATYQLTTPSEIRAYHRHKKALEALNEFSGGKVENLSSYFTILPNGEIVMREFANFGIFNNE